ncbi:MAG: hypothetical protein KME15_19855 [Drouetiella hepatica Uher 2000/2452]|jgi:hypothetical protein|uniref:Uncharacterized protein n=1 Tax=Drouetiella hepatica Uher 2000/2452 TaxID=904376 RepID=A0A951UNN2_9CYAN|nr:hypothetical protein [Drouetiella hepatica Uher 2000/2452]
MTTIESQVAVINFTVYRGADFVLPLDFQQDSGAPIDFTGSMVSAKLRRHFIQDVAVFGVTIAQPTTGKVVLSLDQAVIDTLKPASYSWALFITDAAGVTQLKCQGTVEVVQP